MTRKCIAFSRENALKCIQGEKWATTRQSPKGEPGDTFAVYGSVFQIQSINFITLSEVAQRYYREEGYRSPEDFIKDWQSLHGGQYNPVQAVYIHFFKEVSWTADYCCPYCGRPLRRGKEVCYCENDEVIFIQPTV